MYKYSAMQKAGGSPGSSSPVNLIINGGFESGTDSWIWVEAGTTFEIETTTVYAGSQSAKVTIGGPGNNIAQDITTIIGQDYRFSGWAYADAAAETAYMYAANLPYAGIINSAVTTTKGAWVNLTFTFTASGTTTYIGCGLTAGEGDIAYFDEVEVYEV